jgi:hypothetical protein
MFTNFVKKINHNHMKTICTISFIFFFIAISNAQVIFSSNFEQWTAGNPDNWMGSATNIGSANVLEYTDSPYAGSKACKLVNTANDHKRFTTEGLTIEQGATYTIKFFAKGKGDIRTGLFNGDYTYNNYISVQTTEWTAYQQTISSNNSHTNGQFIFSLRNTQAENHIIIDEVVVSILSGIDTIPIYDIQYTTDISGVSPYKEEIVFTSGIVTAVHGDGYFIQDGIGAWSGLYIYDKDNTPQIGDSLLVKGEIVEYFGMTEMTNVSVFEKLGTATVPQPTLVTTNQVNQEAYESVLVKVGNAVCINANAGFGMWTVNDGSGACKVHNLIYQYTPMLNVVYGIIGPVFFTFDEFRIEPRSSADVIVQTTVPEHKQTNQFKIYPNPANDFISIESNETLYLTITDITGKTVYSSNIKSISQYIDISTFDNGFYSIQGKKSDGTIISDIFIKQ